VGVSSRQPCPNGQEGEGEPGRVRYLTPEEREALLKAAPPALCPYIVAALQTGARRGELLQLRWADVDMRVRTITFPKTKNGDSRSCP